MTSMHKTVFTLAWHSTAWCQGVKNFFVFQAQLFNPNVSLGCLAHPVPLNLCFTNYRVSTTWNLWFECTSICLNRAAIICFCGYCTDLSGVSTVITTSLIWLYFWFISTAVIDQSSLFIMWKFHSPSNSKFILQALFAVFVTSAAPCGVSCTAPCGAELHPIGIHTAFDGKQYLPELLLSNDIGHNFNWL